MFDRQTCDYCGAIREAVDVATLHIGGRSLRACHGFLDQSPTCYELVRLNVRVGAWVKGWCSWKPGVHPKYAWEPVIFRGGRVPDYAVRDGSSTDDSR